MTFKIRYIKTLVIIINLEVILPQNFDDLCSCLMLKKKSVITVSNLHSSFTVRACLLALWNRNHRKENQRRGGKRS